MDEDYYKILGVSRDASQSDVQKAYRKMARKYHPDMNPDDASAKARFQQVQKAYEVLNDPQKRELYDRYGAAFESMGTGAGPGAGGWRTGSGGGAEEFDFRDFFGGRYRAGGAGEQVDIGDIESFFRQFTGARAGPQRRAAPRRGADLTHQIEVPFNVAVLGGQAQVTIRRGSGKVDNLSLKIPPGTDDGKKMRLRGQGEPSPEGGTAGDLLITVRVAPHPYFRRHGNDLEVTLPVTVAEAALGAQVDVPTPRGTISLKIPPGSSSGKRLRAKGQGVKLPDGQAGDLYAQLQITLPAQVDDQSKQLIRELDQRQQPWNPRTELQW